MVMVQYAVEHYWRNPLDPRTVSLGTGNILTDPLQCFSWLIALSGRLNTNGLDPLSQGQILRKAVSQIF
jgi:hypothetical protein